MTMYTLLEVSRQGEIIAVVAVFESKLRADHYIAMISRSFDAIASRTTYDKVTTYHIEYQSGRVVHYRLVPTQYYE